MKLAAIIALGFTAAVSARPAGSRMMYRRQALENGQDAIALNEGFKNLQEGGACTEGENACIGDRFAQCVNGALASQACAPGTICAALPLVNARGTSITCTTPDDVAARIGSTGAQAPPPGQDAPPPPEEEAPPPPPPVEEGNDGGNGDGGNNDGGDQTPPDGGANNNGEGGAAGNDAGNNGGGDPQTSLTLDPGVISQNFANDGQDVPADGQVPSLTSSNNFINFCLTSGLPLTNGQQNRDGSCNTAPIGMIPSVTNMPASKFANPKNGDVINGVKQPFTIVMNIARMQTGSFVNAQQNYFAAPQQLNDQGQIIGHSHVVIELLESLESTQVPDPNVFAFFKGVNTPAQGGQLTAEVNEGLDAGAYRLCSINAAANHQPIIVPVAQHGMIDDCVYFTVAA
ncbi:hypothetical protein BDV98DRAFT_540387 [Pterulicium gracile]|uniref:Carbohydrate-binding module family 19 domain-containing protein n=1 Tax=Pterulicium gracile TaxID=1884261 RepID=A0A5C3QWD0_9AGAR|nr:hypothetical protein BDV98DRAFT_540387 [Pterula gracilis]